MIPGMPRKDWSARLDRATFRCGRCRGTFTAVPDLVDDDPDNPAHPFRYFANCPDCGMDNVPQASWERALMAAHQAATGPVTTQGKAATAANLAGHPTPEESRLIRFNAMKHGMEARTASYFPAKPDKYPFCVRCEVERGWCAGQPACVKQTELFMLHHAAMDQRDPKVLGKIHADLVASITAALQLCIQAVLGDGVVIKTPRVELSRDGYPVTLTYEDGDGTKRFIYDYQSNPLFKPITDLISRLGLSMTDLGLTVKAAEEDDPAGIGMLQANGGSSKESLADFSRRSSDAMLGLREKLGRAQARMRSDPVLIEHEAQGDGA
jgi:hypothetical protein